MSQAKIVSLIGIVLRELYYELSFRENLRLHRDDVVLERRLHLGSKSDVDFEIYRRFFRAAYWYLTDSKIIGSDARFDYKNGDAYVEYFLKERLNEEELSKKTEEICSKYYKYLQSALKQD